MDLTRFQYAGPRHLGVGVLTHILKRPIRETGHDTALQQAVIERGEAALVPFVNSIVRVAIPMALPGVVALTLLLCWYPAIGLIAVAGGALDVLTTIYLNRVLRPLYRRLQELDYERQRTHTQIFRNFLSILIEERHHEVTQDYDERFSAFAGFGIHTGRRFLHFQLGRGVIINITNLCTWVIGAWYVSSGTYTLGYFLASLSWSSYVLNVVGAGIEMQKQWMETMPAINALFAELDATHVHKLKPNLVTPETCRHDSVTMNLLV